MSPPWFRHLRPGLAPLVLASLTACASAPPVLPPLTPTPSNNHHVGQFVWYDLLTNDLEGSKRFYGELFGWTFDDGGEDSPAFTTILHKGKPIGGIAYTREMKQDVNASQWVSSLSTADVDRAAQEVVRLGGTLQSEIRELPNRGRTVLVRDNQGALLALVRSPTGDPPLERATVGGWLWTELWTRNAGASQAFYQELVGYEPQEYEDARTPGRYFLLGRDGQTYAGILAYDFQNVEPNWLPYVRVDDPAPLLRKVEGLGGQVIFAPDPNVRGGSVAVIADPSGAAVTIQKWPAEGGDR